MVKKCFKCRSTKPLTEFYAHDQMADGHLGKCKTCTKWDVKRRYRDPSVRPRIRSYEQARFRDPARKAKVRIYQQRVRAKSPGKYRAWSAVSNAVRDGRLIRKPCEVCNNSKSQAHHDDYRKVLDIRWLCFKHHREIAHGQRVG